MCVCVCVKVVCHIFKLQVFKFKQITSILIYNFYTNTGKLHAIMISFNNLKYTYLLVIHLHYLRLSLEQVLAK